MRQVATQIENETQVGGNTASRVGGLFNDVVDKLGDQETTINGNVTTIKMKRNTAAGFTASNPVLADGELGFETDRRRYKMGDGVTAWNSLAYRSEELDATPTPNSTNGVESGGVFDATTFNDGAIKTFSLSRHNATIFNVDIKSGEAFKVDVTTTPINYDLYCYPQINEGGTMQNIAMGVTGQSATFIAPIDIKCLRFYGQQGSSPAVLSIIKNAGAFCEDIKASMMGSVATSWAQGYQNGDTLSANSAVIHTEKIHESGNIIVKCSNTYKIHSVYVYGGTTYNIPVSSPSSQMEAFNVPSGIPFVVNLKRVDNGNISPSEGANVTIDVERALLNKGEIVNNLFDGGTEKVLSAEQGKQIGGAIFGKDIFRMGGIMYNDGSIVVTAHNVYTNKYFPITSAVNANVIYKGQALVIGNRYYNSSYGYLGTSYSTSAAYWRCTFEIPEDTTLDIVCDNTTINVDGVTYYSPNGKVPADRVFYYNGVDYDDLQQRIDSMVSRLDELWQPLNKTLFPEDFKGDTIEEKIENLSNFLVAANGHFVVYFGKSSLYTINEAIILPSNTVVLIDGCKIKLNTRIHDNIFRTANIVEPVKYDFGSVSGIVENIHIIGSNGAILEGVDEYYSDANYTYNSQHYGWHGNLIYFQSVDGFSVSGVHFEKNCGWCTNFEGCYNGMIHDITMNTRASNGDCIDLIAGCHNIKVWNISGHTEDDTVAVGTGGVDRIAGGFEVYPSQILPFNSDEYLNKSPLYNIEITNVHSYSDISHNVCLISWTGIEIHHIYLSDIGGYKKRGAHTANVVFWGNNWDTGYTDGAYHHIFANNIDATYAPTAFQFAGMPHDSWFNNVLKGTNTSNPYNTNTSGVTLLQANTQITNKR